MVKLNKINLKVNFLAKYSEFYKLENSAENNASIPSYPYHFKRQFQYDDRVIEH